jgi:hypothetical protein
MNVNKKNIIYSILFFISFIFYFPIVFFIRIFFIFEKKKKNNLSNNISVA